jgi:hypothetical protein
MLRPVLPFDSGRQECPDVQIQAAAIPARRSGELRVEIGRQADHEFAAVLLYRFHRVGQRLGQLDTPGEQPGDEISTNLAEGSQRLLGGFPIAHEGIRSELRNGSRPAPPSLEARGRSSMR